MIDARQNLKDRIEEIQRSISRDLWEEIGNENGWFND